MTGKSSAVSGNSGGPASFITVFIGICEKIPGCLIALLARFVIGMAFWLSGRTKVDGFSVKDTTFLLFENEFNLPVIPPVPAAYITSVAEHVLPILLWIGLATRFSAAALLIMTLVIQTFVYPGAYVTHGLWGVALLVLMKNGPGVLSLDYLIRRKCQG